MASTMDITRVTLPGGWLDPSGALHRDGWLRPLTGGDEDWLLSRDGAPDAELVTGVLARCVLRIGPDAATPEMIRDLSVGDRDYLMLRLCEATLGPSMPRVVRCPHAACGAKLDLDLRVTDFPVEAQATQAHHRLMLRDRPGDASGDLEIAFRVPRGRDQEQIATQSLASAALLRDQLLDACIVRAARADGSGELAPSALSARDRQAVAEAIERVAAKVDLDLEIVCPACENTFALPIDPAGVLLEQIGASRAAFERELHLLAFHYHWSLGELMALTRPRRRRFLHLLSEQLGARGER